ncbi:unnamed protein product [Malassezia sympodialis ATCC 42132]|uniref:uncharacterized protein n=1 Tax=Malassezia sympodialis (strain ATCC 42132) TaxID=1230383 RepID=UPI0002C1D8F8|nr:uncharacterized protein MSY001_3359 [Malassezia sympodialis ATCC 42132]CCV00653.1 unnamed protein product [Malassezia sympodialis ATCC 42132]|eukprot:XP_018741835.1 uncharacterized protein MSY001_3359 [Malassezia sympodialis ATCC 42132]
MRASAAPLSQQLMCLRMNSTKGPNKADDTSAQKKLDELADFLESQPQEKTRPMRAPRAKLDQSQPESFRGPTKTLNPDNMRSQPRRKALPLLGPSKREAMKTDPFHILAINPSKPSLADDSYKNGAILSNFVSEMGKILPRNVTGLTRKSQRYVGKAIRRARAMGILPVLSRGQGRGGAGWR